MELQDKLNQVDELTKIIAALHSLNMLIKCGSADLNGELVRSPFPSGDVSGSYQTNLLEFTSGLYDKACEVLERMFK